MNPIAGVNIDSAFRQSVLLRSPGGMRTLATEITDPEEDKANHVPERPHLLIIIIIYVFSGSYQCSVCS
jgi:hypothetical protein